MPRISAFFGIVIKHARTRKGGHDISSVHERARPRAEDMRPAMYYGDHPPPHFHARYGDETAKIAIATGDVIVGSLSGRAQRLVREWASQHRAELEANWERVEQHRRPETIEPLREAERASIAI